MFTLTIQRSVDGFVFPFRPAPNDCNVFLVQLVSLHQEPKIARGRGYGCLTDILLGLVGSVLGGWIFRKLEIGTGTGGFIYSLAAATVGAVVLVVIVHLFTGSKE